MCNDKTKFLSSSLKAKLNDMKKFLLLLVFVAGVQNAKAQIPGYISDTLQDILDGYQGPSIPGISASAYINGYGIWQGATGDSYLGTDLDTTMLMGIGSDTKLFTSVLVLKMVENGILTLDDELNQWLPSYPNIDSSITIRQCLQHQSGVFNYTNHPDFGTDVFADLSAVWPATDILNYVNAPLFAPGADLIYCNTGYVLAGLVLESATGIPYETLVRDSILTPLQMNSTFVGGLEPEQGVRAHPHDGSTNLFTLSRIALESSAYSAGSIVSKPSDMVKWYHAVFNLSFINAQSMAELTSWTSNPLMGLGLVQYQYSGKTYWGHGGAILGYRSMMVYDPDCGHSVSVLRNNLDYDPVTVANDLIATLCDITSTIGLEEKELSQVDIYPNPAMDAITIEIEESILNSSYRIVDLQGKTVLLDELDQLSNTVDIGELNNGLYHVQIGNLVYKIMKD